MASLRKALQKKKPAPLEAEGVMQTAKMHWTDLLDADCDASLEVKGGAKKTTAIGKTEGKNYNGSGHCFDDNVGPRTITGEDQGEHVPCNEERSIMKGFFSSEPDQEGMNLFQEKKELQTLDHPQTSQKLFNPNDIIKISSGILHNKKTDIKKKKVLQEKDWFNFQIKFSLNDEEQLEPDSAISNNYMKRNYICEKFIDRFDSKKEREYLKLKENNQAIQNLKVSHFFDDDRFFNNRSEEDKNEKIPNENQQKLPILTTQQPTTNDTKLKTSLDAKKEKKKRRLHSHYHLFENVFTNEYSQSNELFKPRTYDNKEKKAELPYPYNIQNNHGHSLLYKNTSGGYRNNAMYNKCLKNIQGNYDKYLDYLYVRSNKIVEENKQHTCLICKVEFKRLSTLKIFLISHFNSGNFFDCSLCSNSLKSNADLKKHQKRYHKDTLKKECINKQDNKYKELKLFIGLSQIYEGKSNPFKNSFCFNCFTYPKSVKFHPCEGEYGSLLECVLCKKEVQSIENHILEKNCLWRCKITFNLK